MKLSFRLLLLVLIAALPVLAIQMQSLREQREQQKGEIARQALQLARLAAAQQDQFIESARFLLTAAARLPEVRSLDGPLCSAHMVEIREQFPSIMGIGAADPSGRLFCSSAPGRAGTNIADRPYFERALRAKSLAISGYIIGRGSGEPTLNFAYPALDDAGEVAAVVVLAYDLRRLSDALPSTPIAPGATISLIDGNGILLARAPQARERIGQRVSEPEFSAAMLARREGILEGEGIDGVDRLHGFAPLYASSDLFAVVGLPWREAFAQADRLFWREVGVTVLAFAVAALVALVSGEIWILRPVAALGDVVGRVAAGDLSARARSQRGSSPELRELADSVNAMARALEGRQMALQDSEARFRSVVETAADGIVTINERGIIEAVNPEAERLFGHRRDELIGHNVRILMPSPDRERHDGYVARYLRTGEARIIGIGRDVTGQRKDGGTFPISLSIGEFDLHGTRYFTGIVRDISERRQFEQHQRLLVAEIDHRAKNLLAAVQSMILLSKREARSVDNYTATLVGRIGAMSRTHDLLSRDNWEGVRLHDLVRGELFALAGENSDVVVIAGDDVLLEPRPAQTLALAVHELTTNAAKYGALSVPEGCVTISSSIQRGADGRVLRLRWVESGGPEVQPPGRRGFGSTLIERGIAHDLGGSTRTDFPPEGLRCDIEIPLERALNRKPVTV